MKAKILAIVLALSLIASTTVISLATDHQVPKSIEPILLFDKLTVDK